ncbi:30S ribosomal protein S11 [Mesomycoplasma conjunctivae]|uniref:Small ribosomal subunit protein uS11 n=1 Tax=Mesomycoplasma conjunctivae (strain ATCC 25834 / NCTC 10147 / HRC/581) TaxID=572263 RepID=C5J5V5_MESCH|nr:30S ribosomal protein S11 [Mesomycoplasma conjunctivae]CAT04844.1 30S ribosomal protein S11 [Mesomycoplasma conjunctivae]VEU65906.1 30S ribosomal protein S11 [Mesomycoplasma conjunctivae]
MAKKEKVKKVKSKNITTGIVHIHSSHQNTIVSFTDKLGNVISWSSAGHIGFKGTKKKTAYAASLAANAAAERAKEHGIKEVIVELKGTGQGKEAAKKQILTAGINIIQVKDVTPIPHNGTRPPRKYFKRLEKR